MLTLTSCVGDIEDLDIMAAALAEIDAENIEKFRDYLPGKKAAMFTPKTEEDNIYVARIRIFIITKFIGSNILMILII